MRDDDRGHDVLRVRLVRRQGDPVAAQGVLRAAGASLTGLSGPVYPPNDTRAWCRSLPDAELSVTSLLLSDRSPRRPSRPGTSASNAKPPVQPPRRQAR